MEDKQAVNLNQPGATFDEEVDTESQDVDAKVQPVHTAYSLYDECPKFRILIIGQAGSGKSTICSRVFGIPDIKAGVSSRARGTKRHQVWQGIEFPHENGGLILHDSGGFEAGDRDAISEIEKFISSRKAQTSLAEQIHCIWYCISCRSNRPIQAAEETFFRTVDVGKIPVMVVFTQFDVLEGQYLAKYVKQYWSNNRDNPDTPVSRDRLQRDATNAAIADYDSNYRQALTNLIGPRLRVGVERVAIPDAEDDSNETLSPVGVTTLVKNTLDILRTEGLKNLWIAVQRHSADLKLELSIEICLKLFWRVAGSNTIPIVPFIGARAIFNALCITMSHVTDTWGLYDPDNWLAEKVVRNKFTEGVLDVSAPKRWGVVFLKSLDISGPLTLVLTTALTLRMIAGITLIHERLFWKQRSTKDPSLALDDIKATVAEFRKSRNRQNMTAMINGSVSFSKCLSKNSLHEILRRSIRVGQSEENREYTSSSTVVAD